MSSATTTSIGRYEILGELGRGSMGIVYKARDPQLDRIVAIKTVPAEDGVRRGGQLTEVQKRLHDEATAVARLNHPNIVAVYDVVIAEQTPCIVMEYVEGRTLRELIADGPLRPDRAVHVSLQVCHALHYAHRLGVVHRDIKSGNILVAESWEAKLSDFSIARLKGRDTTRTGVMMGTPAYMAPEQVRGRVAEPRSDLFSLGVVLYEAVTGVSPFQADDIAAVLFQIAHVDPVPPRQLNSAVSPALDAVIRRAMDKEPDRRYPSAQALAEALARASGPAAPSRWSARFRLASLEARWRRAVVVGGACLLIAGAASSDSEVRRAPAAAAAPPAGPSASVETMSESRAARSSARQPVPRAMLHTGTAAKANPVPPPTRTVVSDRSSEPASSTTATGCLSVNAIPFASVYVDGRHVGDTPRACLRIPIGEHRVQFQGGSDQSPERIVRVTDKHTPENPVTLSYDFRSRQYRTP
ncbi:MAG TPA: serine/threonine-protein kinase [Methylomirabilota bacterium]|nr:serine/threonine-protein kinase [Methylomirabilota bacterium]